MVKAIKSLFSDKSNVFLSSQPQVTSFYNEEQVPNHQSEYPQFYNRQDFDQYGDEQADEDQIPQSPGDFSSQLSRDPETGCLL